MKRFKLQRPLLLCIAATLFACASNAMAGSCVAVDSKTETLNFGASLASSTLTIPADTPNGTVVYQDTVRSTGHIWSCSKISMFGIQINPKLGTATGTTSIFPLGKSGLSYRVWFEALSRYETALQAIAPNTSYGFGGNSVRLEIIKTGELTSKVNIDAGYLGSLQDDDLILKRLNLMNPIVLNAASCQTPSVPVTMGDDYQLHDFREAGATSRKVRFDIALNQCQTGIKKVTYSLKANTPLLDATKGVVALNANSTAKGIGLQVMNELGQPIAFDTTYPFSGFTTTGLNFKIPFTAAYYRLGTERVEAGSANTEVTFIVNYL